MFPKILSEHEVSNILGVSLSTLRRWRAARLELPYLKMAGKIGYREDDIQGYLQKKTIEPSSGNFLERHIERLRGRR